MAPERSERTRDHFRPLRTEWRMPCRSMPIPRPPRILRGWSTPRGNRRGSRAPGVPDRQKSPRCRLLAGLDDRMLADIGLTRGDVRDAYSEPVWRDPTAILVSRAHERRINRRRTGLGLAEKIFEAPSIVPSTEGTRLRRPGYGSLLLTSTNLARPILPRRPPDPGLLVPSKVWTSRARRPSRRALFLPTPPPSPRE